MEVWKIIFLSKWGIGRFHVNLPGCNIFDMNHLAFTNPMNFETGSGQFPSFLTYPFLVTMLFSSIQNMKWTNGRQI